MTAITAISSQYVFKICRQDDWDEAVSHGLYRGSADDFRDGYIHLSTAEQLPGTAVKYFAGQPGLVLVAFQVERLGPSLRWEPSRGGQLFPHLYAALAPADAAWLRPLPLAHDGLLLLPKDL